MFPALLKPNTGDSSQGITKDAVVKNEKALLDYLERLRVEFPQAVCARAGVSDRTRIFGRPDRQSRSGLAGAAAFWRSTSRTSIRDCRRFSATRASGSRTARTGTQIRYQEATLSEIAQQQLVEHSTRLFERLGCRDYARFDFRADSKGEIKLLEVNPNPGWCWDGKLNIMAGFQGMRYSELLAQILQAAVERLSIVGKPQAQPQTEAAQ